MRTAVVGEQATLRCSEWDTKTVVAWAQNYVKKAKFNVCAKMNKAANALFSIEFSDYDATIVSKLSLGSLHSRSIWNLQLHLSHSS